MLRFLAVRALQAVVTLLVATLIVFALARVSGSPADVVLPPEATPAERVAYIKRMGLDRPVTYQYWVFIRDAALGDWGTSIRTGRPATELVWERLVNSLKLATAALAATLVIGLPLGILAAVYRGGAWDRLGMAFALLGQSLPAFWLGIVLILVFSVVLGWLPTSGMESWRHYVLPAFVMGWGISAGVVRLLRSSMLDVLGADFVRVARAKGLSEAFVVNKHAFMNALIPVLTFVGYMYGVIIASAIVIEVVFGWPGLGRLAYESTLWRDYPVLQLTVVAWAALVIVINMLVDVAYALVDPRIRGT
jgi:peptide/nickel transport system permease protein